MAGTAEILDPTIPVVKSLVLMDSEGKRIAVKYYSPEWCARGGGAGGGAIGPPTWSTGNRTRLFAPPPSQGLGRRPGRL